MMLDPSLDRDLEVDRVWAFADFGGFLDCFKFTARRLRGPADYALITRRMMEAALQRQGITYAEVTLGAGVVQWLGFNFATQRPGAPFAKRSGKRTRSGRSKSGGISTPSASSGRTTSWKSRNSPRAMWVTAWSRSASAATRCWDRRRRIPRRLPLCQRRRPAEPPLRTRAKPQDPIPSAPLSISARNVSDTAFAPLEDPDLIRRLREERIPLEVCITSNVRTGAVAIA